MSNRNEAQVASGAMCYPRGVVSFAKSWTIERIESVRALISCSSTKIFSSCESRCLSTASMSVYVFMVVAEASSAWSSDFRPRTFWPTMITGKSTNWRNVCEIQAMRRATRGDSSPRMANSPMIEHGKGVRCPHRPDVLSQRHGKPGIDSSCGYLCCLHAVHIPWCMWCHRCFLFHGCVLHSSATLSRRFHGVWSGTDEAIYRL